MGLAAALIGGVWQVATRAAITTASIAPADLVILRYGIPTLILAPVLWRIGLVPKTVHRLGLVLIWTGAGLPFGLIAILGTRFAPASHMGVMMAGASPLLAAVLSWLLWREHIGRQRLIGLALMVVAIALLSAKSLLAWSSETWRGDLLFLAAALLWAIYSLTFRRLQLSSWQAAAIVNAWSALAVLIWTVIRCWVEDGIGLVELPASTLAWHALWQGLLAGVLGLWTFSVAISRLGAAQAAAFGALAPAVSALAGWVWLGDALTPIDAVAVAVAAAGVLAASGALRRAAIEGRPR